MALVLVIWPVSAPRAAPPSSDPYAAAVEAFGRRDFEEAFALLEIAFAKEPLPVYAFNMGRAREEQGRFEDAAVLYERTRTSAGRDRALAERATDRLGVVGPRRGQALLRVPPEAARGPVWLDGRALVNADGEQTVSAGTHLLCAARPDVLRCWPCVATLGRRVDCASARPEVVHVALGALASQAHLEVDGLPVPPRPSGVSTIGLDPGAHTVRATGPEGTGVATFQLAAGGETHFEVAEAVVRAPEASAASVRLAPAVVSSSALSAVVAPWIVAGTGGALALTGVGLVLWADDLRDPDGRSQIAAETDWERSRTITPTGWALVGVGAAVTLAGVLWGTLDSSAGDVDNALIWLAIDPAQGVLTLGGTF